MWVAHARRPPEGGGIEDDFTPVKPHVFDVDALHVRADRVGCGQASQEGMEQSRNPPDGSRTGTILFVRMSGSNFHSDLGAQLLLMRSDGSAQHPLTKNAAHDAYPALSPD
jgi:hypothetical protein